MIFIDTSAWVAMAVRSDRHHRHALEAKATIDGGSEGRLVTTDSVLSETATLLSRRVGPQAAASFLESVLEADGIDIQWATPARFAAATRLMRKRPDKQWSHVDCQSFVLMNELGVRAAFTFDSDFEQAGFKVLP